MPVIPVLRWQGQGDLNFKVNFWLPSKVESGLRYKSLCLKKEVHISLGITTNFSKTEVAVPSVD